MAARIIQFPGPKTKPEPKNAQPAETTMGQAPAPPRQLSEREVDHRRQMLMHLQCLGDSAQSR